MQFEFPLRLPSLTNTRMHWTAVARLKRRQKSATWAAILRAGGRAAIPAPPLVVTLTRCGRRLLDDDNLAAAFKHVRDALAEVVGVDDGSPLYTWKYAQRVGRGAAYGVAVEIAPRPLPAGPEPL